VRVLAVLVCALAVACSRDERGAPTSTPPNTERVGPSSGLHALHDVVEKWLPYGVPIPEGTLVNGAPEPYDPAKHGPLAEPSERDNDLLKSGFVAPTRGSASKLSTSTDLALLAPGDGPHENRGWTVADGRGLWLRVDVQRNVTWPAGKTTTLYAPTSMPPNNSCLEAKIAHYRTNPSDPITHAFGVWSHCPGAGESPGWAWFETMSTTWVSKYVRSMQHADGSGYEEGSWLQVYSANATAAPGTPDTWYALIFNFNTGHWDLKATKTGVGQFGTGWTQWEVYWRNQVSGGVGCPNLPGISSEAISIRLAGVWYALHPIYDLWAPAADQQCWKQVGGTYSLDAGHAPVMWHAHTPGGGQ
jgi:hypothetical protein